MLSVALTGNGGAGKSTLASLLKIRGAAIVDADDLARQAAMPGMPAYDAVMRAWPEVRQPNGEVDRRRLGEIVFASPAERERLNAIFHPEIERLRKLKVAELEAQGAAVVVCEIPLLFEVGRQAEFDVVVLVKAPRELRKERIIARDHRTADDADRLFDAQMPDEVKQSTEMIVVENTGGVDALCRRSDEVWKLIEERAASQ